MLIQTLNKSKCETFTKPLHQTAPHFYLPKISQPWNKNVLELNGMTLFQTDGRLLLIYFEGQFPKNFEIVPRMTHLCWPVVLISEKGIWQRLVIPAITCFVWALLWRDQLTLFNQSISTRFSKKIKHTIEMFLQSYVREKVMKNMNLSIRKKTLAQ